MNGSDYVARLNGLDLSGTSRAPSSSMPPPISGHDLMAMFPTVPPSSEVCCDHIFKKQARAYLSGSREGTATPEGDAVRHRVDSGSSPAPTFARRDSAAPRHSGLDALAEQACMGSPSSSSSSSTTLRTPPVDRASSRSTGTEQDGEAVSRQSRSRQSKAQRAEAGLMQGSTLDRRTNTPRPSSSHTESPTPLFTRRPLERTAYPRFVSSTS
ncbi:hypothetical protein EIP86_008679 [Pleurotus ostreatoroseus]|nr:hypothetical protein EIP86_008679 [Pleurotus ostreatoroseus]